MKPMDLTDAGWCALARDVFELDDTELAAYHVHAVRTALMFLPVRPRMALELRYGLHDGLMKDFDEVQRLLPASISSDKTVPKSPDVRDARQLIALALLRLRQDLSAMPTAPEVRRKFDAEGH